MWPFNRLCRGILLQAIDQSSSRLLSRCIFSHISTWSLTSVSGTGSRSRLEVVSPNLPMDLISPPAVVGEEGALWPKEDVQVIAWSTTQLNYLTQTSFPRAPTTERRRLRNRSPVRSTGDNVLTIDRCVLNGQSPHCRLFLLLRLKENVQVIIPDASLTTSYYYSSRLPAFPLKPAGVCGYGIAGKATSVHCIRVMMGRSF